MANINAASSISTGPAQVTVIRFALFMGIALFGLVCWFALRPQMPMAEGEDLSGLLYGFYALLAIAIVVATIMKRKQADTTDWGKRVTYGIVGWAACEATALFGGVYWMLSGDPKFYVAGALLLVVSLILLAPKQEGVMG